MKRQELEEILDRKLEEKLEQKLDEKLDQKLDEKLAVFFRRFTKYFDNRIDSLQTQMTQRFERLETTIDGMAKRVDDSQQEQAAINHQLGGHEGWVGQLAKSTKTKLVPEP